MRTTRDERATELRLDAMGHERWAARTMAVVRMAVALLWLTNTGWKLPPDFGEEGGGSLYGYTVDAVEHPVFDPYSAMVESMILPNFQTFGWLVWITEISLGAFLLVGLATRFWAIVGAVQSAAIGLSVAFAPEEWPWAYYLMVAAHLALLATAAGRTWGLDEIVRPVLAVRPARWTRWATVAT
jgi:thiosulfate dehydrogenase [quinone] large subunit